MRSSIVKLFNLRLVVPAITTFAKVDESSGDTTDLFNLRLLIRWLETSTNYRKFIYVTLTNFNHNTLVTMINLGRSKLPLLFTGTNFDKI